MRVERHKSGVWVREDGCVYVPQSGKHPAHWTFGCKRRDGYRQVKIAGKHYFVHRLVAETYFGGIPEGCEVDHINRDRLDNRLENLRIVTSHENHLNTSAHDRIDARGGTHKYEDFKRFCKEQAALYRKMCKKVRFSDGKQHWLPNEEAEAYLLVPLKERHYGK